jgi:hypothetical protein
MALGSTQPVTEISKVKVNFTLEKAMKAQGGVEV